MIKKKQDNEISNSNSNREKKSSKSSSFSYFSLTVLVLLFAMYLAIPHKDLDWDGVVLPMARKYAISTGSSDITKITTTTSSSSDTQQQQQQKPLIGKIVLITGPTSGIGLALTRAFTTKLGATVIAVGRSKTKLDNLVKEITTTTTNNNNSGKGEGDGGIVQPIIADFMNLESVRDAANTIIQKYDHIDIMINNVGMHDAGKLFLDQSGYSTKHGYDRVFTVNYLSAFLLTEKLAPIIQNGTIVQISSSFHWGVDGEDLIPSVVDINNEDHKTNLQPIASRPGGSTGGILFRTMRSYSNSKFAQILHARGLKTYNNYLQNNTRIISLCPAWVATDIVAKTGTIRHHFLSRLHYPMEGWGISSALYATFDRSSDPDKDDYYVNTPLSILPPTFILPHWTYEYLIRDVFVFIYASTLGFIQKLIPKVIITNSSPETYDQQKIKALYNWSYNAISEFL